jgi:hypothetical protein
MTVVPMTIGSTRRAKMTTTARSLERTPACISFFWAFSTCSCWSIFSDPSRLLTLSATSFLLVMLRRRFEVEATMPALSCSRRSLSAFTLFAIGSLTVVAA